ncbi:MAG: glycosyltransferase [Sedimentisphaerales bacterium]|nr:glycosyltransferase [Sedimentisphaerales bacterium]
MTRNHRPILYICRYYQPLTSAAAIRAHRFVEGLVQSEIPVIVLTVGDKAHIQTISSLLTVCQVSARGELPPDISTRNLSGWPWWQVLPGPGSESKVARAMAGVCPWLIKEFDPALILVTAPPFSLSAVGCELAHKYSLPVVQEFRDAWFTGMPWPYSHVLQRRSGRFWEKQCVLRADKVITVTDTYRKLLMERYGQSLDTKIVTIRHGYDQDSQEELPLSVRQAIQGGVDKPFVMAYIGQLRGVDMVDPGFVKKCMSFMNHGLRRVFLGANFCENLQLEWMSGYNIIRAVADNSKDNAEFARRARLIFAGQKYAQIDHWAGQLGLENNVVQLGPLPAEQARQVAQEADLLILSLYGIKDCSYHWCVPSKIYAYLATGKPILGLLPPGEAADIATAAGTGIIVPPDGIPAITEQIKDIFFRHTAGSLNIRPDWKFIQQFELARQQQKFTQLIISLLDV